MSIFRGIWVYEEGVSECGIILFDINVIWLSSECLSVFLSFLNVLLKINDGNLIIFSEIFLIILSKFFLNFGSL